MTIRNIAPLLRTDPGSYDRIEMLLDELVNGRMQRLGTPLICKQPPLVVGSHS